MKLKIFIKRFIEPNTIIRLWYKNEKSYISVNDCIAEMEHKIINGNYCDNNVIGITDIVISPYSEAVNIVIEKDNQ